jgi:hypothetical protein
MSSEKESAKPAGGEKSGGSKGRTQHGGRPPVEQPTPIIITGGSLRLESQLVDFSDWEQESPTVIHHPFKNRKIPRVVVLDDNNPTATPTVVAAPAIVVTPANGKCTITVEYPPVLVTS